MERDRRLTLINQMPQSMKFIEQARLYLWEARIFFQATYNVPFPQGQPLPRFRSLTPAPVPSSSDSEQSSDSDNFIDDNDDDDIDTSRPVFRRSSS
jgi:hypothetical protein